MWYVPGTGAPVSGLVSYAPAGTKKDAIQTSTSTAARTVNAVGNLNFLDALPCAGVSSDVWLTRRALLRPLGLLLG